MKRVFLLTSLIFLSVFGSAQCIRIYVAQKIQEAEIPVERREFEITINDTMKVNLTSGRDGLLGRIPLERGKYKVLLQNPEFGDVLLTNVSVEESLTKNLTMNVVPISVVKDEDKNVTQKK